MFRKLEAQGYHVEPIDPNRLEDLVDLFNLASLAMHGKTEFAVEECRLEYESPGFDLEHSTRVVYNPENKPVGVIEIWDHQEVPAHPFIWARVHPDWEGKGIGTSMMMWGLARTREAPDRVPEGTRVSAISAAVGSYQPAMDLHQDLGMNQIRRSWRMSIDLTAAPPEPTWPTGIRIKPFHPQIDAEAVYRAENEAFRDHWGHVEQPFEQGFERWKHDEFNHTHFDPALWFVAMDGEEIAGLSLCHPTISFDPEMGWVGSLSVRRPWRRQGLGLALLQHSFGEFRRLGKLRGGLGVDSSNLTGATRLYEQAGMHVIRTTSTFEYELRAGKEMMTENASV